MDTTSLFFISNVSNNVSMNVSSALGDGAKWIGNIIREVFGQTEECLDIYHALEHVSDCGKALHGEGETFISWLDKMRMVLLSEGVRVIFLGTS